MGIPFISFLILAAVLIAFSWYRMPLAWARILLAAGRSYAKLESRQLETDSADWHYLSGGNGPVLLAIHGFGADADNWLKIAPKLTKQFTVIAPDLPGFGSTLATDDLAFDINSQVERLHAFITKLGIRPAVLVGSSMGGWIAATYASRYPKNIKALWLLGPLGVSGKAMSPIRQSIEAGKDSPFDVRGLGEFRNDVLDRMFVRRPWFPYPLQVYYTRQAEQLAVNAPRMFEQVMQGSEPLEAIAAGLEVPILLQWGDRDLAVDVSGTKVMQGSNRNVEVQIQPDVGHLPMLETPRASLRLFEDFCTHHGITDK